MNYIRMPFTILVLIYVLGRRFGFKTLNIWALGRVKYYGKLGVAYNRIKKNANTSVVILMRELETGKVEERKVAKLQADRLLDLSWREVQELRHAKFFVVVRNPYTRVLSAFLDKFRQEVYKEEFRVRPLTPQGFHEFVLWLRRGGQSKDPHWDLQTKLMLLPLSAYDSVIHFEELREQMTEFLVENQLTNSEGVLKDLYPSDVGKQTSASALVNEFYNQDTKRIVDELYKKDFEELGYPMHLELNRAPQVWATGAQAQGRGG